MNEAIKKAIEGGYGKYQLDKGWNIKSYATTSMPNNFFVEFHDGSDVHIMAIFSDPKFWQALDKQQGWKSYPANVNQLEYVAWKARWHDFIDALIAGQTPDSFFDALLNTK